MTDPTTVDRDGVRIHYETYGDGGGVPVLLTHGFSATGRMFASTIEALAPERRCIVWDVRGHGRSDSPDATDRYSTELVLGDMSAVLDAAAVDRCVLLGHSMGGYLSLRFQALRGERVAGLVLVGTGPGYRDEAARAGWNEMCESFAIALEADGLQGLPALGDEMRPDEHRSVTGLVRAARGILRQHDGLVLEHLPAIDIPVLVVVGEEDRQFLAGSSYMAARIPDARHEVIAGAGHAPMLTHPDAFRDEVEGFLAEVDGTVGARR